MGAEAKLFSLKQKIFVVKSFYRYNEDLKKVLYEFNRKYNLITDEETSMSNFAAIVGSFEMTGSIIPLLLYFNDETLPTHPTITDIKQDPHVSDYATNMDPHVEFRIGNINKTGANEEPNYSNSGNDDEMDDGDSNESGAEGDSDPLYSENEELAGRTGEEKMGLKKEQDSDEQNSSHRIRHRSHECSFCAKSFSSNAGLEMHLRTHTGERPYKCDFCDKTFNQKSSRNTHLRLHTGESPYVCSICNRAFKQSGNLKSHILNIHKKNPSGEQVKKPRENPVVRLARPKKQMPPNPENNTFLCTFCPKAFPFHSGLEIHLRTHTGEKPFKCDYCEKTFNQRSSRNTHHRLHTGEAPFVCNYCGRAFKQSGNFKCHMLRRHGSQIHDYGAVEEEEGEKEESNKAEALIDKPCTS